MRSWMRIFLAITCLAIANYVIRVPESEFFGPGSPKTYCIIYLILGLILVFNDIIARKGR